MKANICRPEKKTRGRNVGVTGFWDYCLATTTKEESYKTGMQAAYNGLPVPSFVKPPSLPLSFSLGLLSCLTTRLSIRQQLPFLIVIIVLHYPLRAPRCLLLCPSAMLPVLLCLLMCPIMVIPAPLRWRWTMRCIWNMRGTWI